jgi:multidrug efflux pump subunit AcrA (membrane-fusion protein)
MIQQRQSRGTTGEQFTPSGASAGSNAQLAEGMTVTVNIITGQSRNTLLVPTQAIISDNGQTSVQVVTDSGTEDRPVEVGISNWQYSEIISGLSEGEQVSVPLNASVTTTGPGNFQQRSPSSGVSGIGRILR